MNLPLRSLHTVMLRKAIYYPLVLLVLAAPSLCLWESAEGADFEQMRCSCCHRDQQSDVPQPSKAPELEPNCFCQGAIVQPKVESPDCQETWQTIDRLVILSSESPSQIADNFFSLLASSYRSFPPGSTGRDICTLVCVLLL